MFFFGRHCLTCIFRYFNVIEFGLIKKKRGTARRKMDRFLEGLIHKNFSSVILEDESVLT